MTYWPQLVNWLINSSSSSSSSSEYFDDESDRSINDDDVVSRDQTVLLADIDSVAGDDPLSSSTASKRRRSDENDESAKRVVSQKRVWTKEDELELLHGFWDYTINRKRIVLVNGQRRQRDHVSSFYSDHVNPELKLRFNKSQTVDKLRRLKRKYQITRSKMSDLVAEFRFRNTHDKATFEISHEIWRRSGDTTCRLAAGSEDATVVDDHVAAPKMTRSQTRAGLRKRAVNNGDVDQEISSDNIRELVMDLGLNYPIGLIKFCDDRKDEGLVDDSDDEKWKEEHIVELEVYLKRLELVQTKVKAALDKLRSKVD